MRPAPTQIRDYDSAVEWLESLVGLGMKLGLERIARLLDQLGRPQDGLRGALIAGTNGKGSVLAMTESVLRAHGLTTASMAKPHLESYRERIALAGQPCSEAQFVEAVREVAAATLEMAESPTLFEAVTAAGVVAAQRAGVEVLVCEVGLGGRLDSTNILDLGTCAVTSIGLDHCELLGDTIPLIAAEKAAIIKPGNVAVAGCGAEAMAMVEKRCREVGATLHRAQDWSVRVSAASLAGLELDLASPEGRIDLRGVRLPLAGHHQAQNARTAAALSLAVLDRVGREPSAAALRRGLETASWPGRLELCPGQPPVVLDGAHNPEALETCLSELARMEPGRPLTVVFGVMSDKDVPTMLSLLAAARPAEVVFTRVEDPRAADPAALAAMYPSLCRVAEPPIRALESARAGASDRGLVLVCGSLYLVGALRRAALSGG